MAIDPMLDTSSLSIVKLCEKLVQQAIGAARKYRDIASINESFVHGDQWGVIETSKGVSTIRRDAWFDEDNVPRVAVNEMAPLLMTWSALMTKDRPSASAVAASDEPEDTYRAEVGDKIIEMMEGELDSANKIHQAVTYAGMHGTAGLKIVYLAGEDKVCWEPLTIFNFLMDPRAHDYRKSSFYIFDDYLTDEEALDRFEAVGIERKPSAMQYKTAAGESLTGVLQRELWLKPCRDYPQGLYAAIIDGEVVEEMPYPFVVKNDSNKPEYLPPLVLMKVRDVRDSAFGLTNFTAAVPLQRLANETVSRIQKWMRTATNIHLKLPQELDGVDLSASAHIYFPSNRGQAAAAIGYTQPGELSPVIERQRDFCFSKMQSVVGLNDVTVGSETRSISGRAIDNIVELDAQKNADATKSMTAMVLDAWRLTLKLVGLYYTSERQGRITNSSIADVISFSGADVQGMDIRLEAASELDSSTSVKTAAAQEQIAAGTAGPLDLARAQKSPGYGMSKRHAEDIIASVLAGQPVEAMPEDLNLEVFAEVIEKYKARALAQGDREAWLLLTQLRSEVEQMEQPAMDAAPAGPATEPAVPEVPPSPV